MQHVAAAPEVYYFCKYTSLSRSGEAVWQARPKGRINIPNSVPEPKRDDRNFCFWTLVARTRKNFLRVGALVFLFIPVGKNTVELRRVVEDSQ